MQVDENGDYRRCVREFCCCGAELEVELDTREGWLQKDDTEMKYVEEQSSLFVKETNVISF